MTVHLTSLPETTALASALGPVTAQRDTIKSNIVECYKVECCFDKVERCFDVVAVFGKNVEAAFDFVAKNGNNVEATGNKVSSCFNNAASTLLLV